MLSGSNTEEKAKIGKKEGFEITNSYVIEKINEDEIIKKIMLEYPNLYDMVNFNEFDIKEKLEKNAWLYQNFRILYIKEKRKLTQLTIIYDEYIGKLYHKLKFENDINITKTEIEKFYLNSDSRAVELKRLILKQTICVETYEAIKDAFKQQGFNMAQFIKNLNL